MLKGELLDGRVWPSRATAQSAIFESIESWYNLHRLHMDTLTTAIMGLPRARPGESHDYS
ncbi:hypothetical protein ACQP1V_28965 [Microtetraspora malaysiensis]|uniref:hypothetical protein n=1 Tax=Microtetraspora malaysiensis TaxID=161358 RepID=UPI003D916C14